jgi:hypothetical protein
VPRAQGWDSKIPSIRAYTSTGRSHNGLSNLNPIRHVHRKRVRCMIKEEREHHRSLRCQLGSDSNGGTTCLHASHVFASAEKCVRSAVGDHVQTLRETSCFFVFNLLRYILRPFQESFIGLNGFERFPSRSRCVCLTISQFEINWS